MTKVLIVYATDYGNTEKMARAVAQGVESVEGASAVLKTAEEAKAEDILAADALVMGTPVHMGSMDWRDEEVHRYGHLRAVDGGKGKRPGGSGFCHRLGVWKRGRGG